MARRSHSSVVQQPFASALAALIAALVLLSAHPLHVPSFAGASSPSLAAPVEGTSDECQPFISRDIPASPTQPPSPQDVVLMIDSSGSMVWNDPGICRLVAAKNYIDFLASPERVSVLDFDSICYWTPAQGGGAEHHLDSPGHDGIPNYTDPKGDVDTIDSMGATNLLCPIEYANAELIGLGNPNHTWVEILLTDGQDTAGNTAADIMAAATNASNAGILIFTIGFGDADKVLLGAIANATGGQFFDAADCSGITLAYESIFEILSATGRPLQPNMLDASVTGSDVRLSWQLSADDGSGDNDVIGYEIWHGMTYDSAASPYTLMATVPAGNTSYVHVAAGGDTSNHFYQVRAVDADGYWTAAPEQAAKLSRFLPAGNQLVSVPLKRTDWTVGAVLQTVPWTHVHTYVDGQWLTKDTQKPWSPLASMEEGRAFWVETSAESWWRFAGLVPSSTQVTLKAGWNLVGYPSLSELSVSQVLAGVDYLTVEGYSGEPPYHLRSLAAADTMSAGSGYWIQVAQDAVLTFTN